MANAGDSRCVLCRDGQALELSLDHKPEDEPEMKRIRKAGGKVTFDGRVNGGLNLSRALGDHAYKQNAVLPPQEQMISALPDVRHITIEPERDEFMILACDGIWNFMSSQDVVQFIKTRLTEKYDNISKICEEVIYGSIVCPFIFCTRWYCLMAVGWMGHSRNLSLVDSVKCARWIFQYFVIRKIHIHGFLITSPSVILCSDWWVWGLGLERGLGVRSNPGWVFQYFVIRKNP